jgi:hypothetical protein
MPQPLDVRNSMHLPYSAPAAVGTFAEIVGPPWENARNAPSDRTRASPAPVPRSLGSGGRRGARGRLVVSNIAILRPDPGTSVQRRAPWPWCPLQSRGRMLAAPEQKGNLAGTDRPSCGAWRAASWTLDAYTYP